MNLTIEKPKLQKTNFRLIEIDESKNWREDILKACGGKITTVYLYNANEETFVMEIRPSHYLIPLYCNVNIPYEEIPSIMQNEFEEGENQNEPIYVHVSDIEKMTSVEAPKSLNGTYITNGGKKYTELMEKAEEYLRGNHQL